MAKPGIVATLASLSFGVQKLFSGMHVISWLTSSGVVITVILVIVCYCRARRKRSRQPYCETVPVRYERRNESGESEKIIINVGKNNEAEERKMYLSSQRKKDIIKLVSPKTAVASKLINKENQWGSNTFNWSKL